MLYEVITQTLWLNTNPIAGSLPHPNRLSEKHIFIKRHLIPHDKIGGTGQLIGKGFGGNSAVCFGHFLLIKPLGFGNVPLGEVSCLNIGPGQVFIAVFLVISYNFV